MSRVIPHKSRGAGISYVQSPAQPRKDNWKDTAPPGVIVKQAGFGNSTPSAAFTNAYGQTSSLLGHKGVPQPIEIEDIYSDIEVRYPAKRHKSLGYFNGGFPFLLPNTSDYLQPPVNEIFINGSRVDSPSRNVGIAKQYNTGIYVENLNPSQGHLGGGFPISASTISGSGFYQGYDFDAKIVTVNNFFNLACIETDFVIRTIKAPAGYETGYCYNSDDTSEEGLQYVTQDWEVVNSYDETAYLPNLRQYPDETGVHSEISISDNGLMDATGLNYSSIHITGEDIGPNADFFVPITIQPDNTGAFVITLDEGVAEYFELLPSYGNKKAFNCNMMFDFQIGSRDHEGFERSTIDYHIFPTKAYIVPALNWDFEVVSSKVKGIYYQYPFLKNARYAGDNASFIDKRMPENSTPLVFPYSLTTSTVYGSYEINYNGINYTHAPFEVRPNYLNNFYGTHYILEDSLTYLSPTKKLLSDSETQSNTYIQKFISNGDYSTDGWGSDPLTFRAIARNASKLEVELMTEHYQGKSLDEDSGKKDIYKFKASDFTLSPYSFGGINNSPFVNSNLDPDENPYKRRQFNNRRLPELGISSHVIAQKIKDLTYPLPDFRKIGSAGSIENIRAGREAISSEQDASELTLNKLYKERSDDTLLPKFPKPTTPPRAVFRTTAM